MTEEQKRRLIELSTQGTMSRGQVDEYIELLKCQEDESKKDKEKAPDRPKNAPTSSRPAQPSEALPSANSVTAKAQEPKPDQIRSKYEGKRDKVNVPSKKPFTPGTKR